MFCNVHPVVTNYMLHFFFFFFCTVHVRNVIFCVVWFVFFTLFHGRSGRKRVLCGLK